MEYKSGIKKKNLKSTQPDLLSLNFEVWKNDNKPIQMKLS